MPEVAEHKRQLAGGLFKNTVLTVEINVKWNGQMIWNGETDINMIKAKC
jgi:hypothetical protein